jgi:hypothetical protein
MRSKLLMKLRTMSPNDRFDEAFDAWVFDTYGMIIGYALPDRKGALIRIEISEENFTMLLLKLKL